MKKYGKLFVGICLSAMLIGCGSGSVAKSEAASYNYADDGVYEAAAEEAYTNDYDASGSGSSSEKADTVDESAQSSSRKLIKTVSMDVQTESFDTLRSSVEKQVKALGGYIENSNMYSSDYGVYANCRSLDLTIRIPKDRLDEFVGEIEQGSNLTRKQESVEDVTLSYVDLKSRKDAYVARKERLMKFMDEATTMEEMLTIDKQLTEVLYQIESMEAQLRTYDNQVDYSTVNLQIQEVKHIEQVAEESMWSQIAVGFTNSLYDVMQGLRGFIIWFLSSLPHLLVWGVIIFVIVFIIRKIVKRKKAKKLAKKEANQKKLEALKKETEKEASKEETATDEMADLEEK